MFGRINVTRVKEKSSFSLELEEKQDTVNTLILYNDEVNTFDFVIDTLIEVCEHEPMQAENCAWITHYRGKCSVKKGPLDDLKPRYNEMTNRMLTVEIK